MIDPPTPQDVIKDGWNDALGVHCGECGMQYLHLSRIAINETSHEEPPAIIHGADRAQGCGNDDCNDEDCFQCYDMRYVPATVTVPDTAYVYSDAVVTLEFECECCAAFTSVAFRNYKGHQEIHVCLDHKSTVANQERAKKRDLCQSEAERRFYDAVAARDADIADQLVPQYKVTIGGSNFYLDFAIPERKIAIEIDGHAFHSDADTFHADRVRQRQIELYGWRFCRFSGREATNSPEQAASQLRTWLSVVERETKGDAAT